MKILEYHGEGTFEHPKEGDVMVSEGSGFDGVRTTHSKFIKGNWKRHRVDGPACWGDDGFKCWCINGEYHRLDGPAFIYPWGDIEYFIEGVGYESKEDWEKAVDVYKIKQITDLF